jgi:uncharacterized membrane protein YesL
MTGLNATTSRPTTSQTTSAPTTTTPPSNQAFQTEYQHRFSWKAGVIGAFNVLTLILSARLILLVSVSGAIALAYLALQASDLLRLGVLAIYAVVVVVPLVWLSSR